MARGESQKTQGGGWRQAYGERRFGVLLGILAVLLAGPPVLLGVGLSAAWFDGRKRSGPMSQPIRTNLQGGGVSTRLSWRRSRIDSVSSWT